MALNMMTEGRGQLNFSSRDKIFISFREIRQHEKGSFCRPQAEDRFNSKDSNVNPTLI